MKFQRKEEVYLTKLNISCFKMSNIKLTNEINEILSQKEIDQRIKPLIKMFFLGKSKLEDLDIEQIKTQIDILCSRIENVEFSSSNKIIVAFENKAHVLTVNKQLFLEGKADEVILPIFMKFEQALSQDNNDVYKNHVVDFIKAGRIAKAISIPISERLFKLYELAEYACGDIQHKIHELMRNEDWKIIYEDYDKALNEMIVTGIDDQKGLLDGVRLFHYEIFTPETSNNPNFEGPYKTEEYQAKASKIIACMETIKPKEYDNTDMLTTQKEQLVKNIKLFTGCTEEMIERCKSQKYEGQPKISTILESEFRTASKELTEEMIIDRVQKLIDKKPEWNSKLKPFVIPFFVRSQKIYHWDIDEFQERVNQLDFKINKMTFEDLGSLIHVADTAGDKIRLNSRVFLNKKRRIKMACKKSNFS